MRAFFPDNVSVDLQLLREETRAQHEATEGLLSLDGGQLDRPRYVRTLQCFYGFVQGWEQWASRHVPARLKAVLHERTRAHLLLRDLEFLGASPQTSAGSPTVVLLDSLLPREDRESPAYEAGFLGSMYVMEGSTLGGQYIARQVEAALGLLPGEGDAYFRGHGERTGAMWNAFRELLAAIPVEHSDIVIAAAKGTFAYVQEKIGSCP